MPQITISHAGVSNKEGEFYSSDSYLSTYYSSPPVSLIRVGTQVLSSIGPVYNVHQAWFRFRIPLNGNVNITRAVLRFTTPDGWPDNPHGGHVTKETSLTIKGHKTANSSGPSNQSDALTQGNTTAEVVWVSDLKARGATFFSPDVKEVLQEILDQGGWAANNYLTIYIQSQYQPFYRPCTITSEQFQINAGYAWPDDWINEPDALAHLVIDYTTNALDGVLVEHELEIEQDITVTTGKHTVVHILEIEQDIVGVAEKIRNVEDELTITQTMKVVVPIELTFYSDIFLIQDIDRNHVQIMAVESVIVFEQEILRQGPLDKQVVSTLTIINDDILATRGYNRSVEDIIEIEEDVETNLKTRTIIHVLAIRHQVSTDGSDLQDPEVVTSTLVFTQDIDWNRSGTRGTIHDLDIEQSFVGYFDTRVGCDRQDINYQPYGSAEFPSKPTLTPQTITLSWPVSSPTEIVALPVPLFGDREEMLLSRVQRTTRGGLLKTFSSDVWPKVRIFRYKFDSLPVEKVIELFEFLGVTLGQRMQLADHEGRLWNGYIVNPQGEAGQFMKVCGNTTEFDFDGVEA